MYLYEIFCRMFFLEMIASKRKLVLEDLEDFEQRSRRYWEGRVDGESKKDEVDPMDEDMELELKEIMKNEDLEDGEDFTITVFETKKEPETANTTDEQIADTEEIELPYEEKEEVQEEENNKVDEPIVEEPMEDEEAEAEAEDQGEVEVNEESNDNEDSKENLDNN